MNILAKTHVHRTWCIENLAKLCRLFLVSSNRKVYLLAITSMRKELSTHTVGNLHWFGCCVGGILNCLIAKSLLTEGTAFVLWRLHSLRSYSVNKDKYRYMHIQRFLLLGTYNYIVRQCYTSLFVSGWSAWYLCDTIWPITVWEGICV